MDSNSDMPRVTAAEKALGNLFARLFALLFAVGGAVQVIHPRPDGHWAVFMVCSGGFLLIPPVCRWADRSRKGEG